MSSLLKTVGEHSLDVGVRLEMRAYFLQYLEAHAPGLEPYVLATLVQLM